MKKTKFLSLMLGVVFSVLSLSAVLTGCVNNGGNGTVEVVYHLNYENGGERRVEIPAGSLAIDWNAPRDGYKIKNWCTDSECKNEYDFTLTVNARLDLYASWREYGGKMSVTFDYNYPGSRSAYSVKVGQGDTVDESFAPTSAKANRIGMELDGWFTDKNCTDKWDFATDTVESDMTLYAGYKANSKIPRNDKGEIIYDNVQVNVWMDNNSCRDTEILIKLAEDFNKEYAGKIQVSASTALDDQALCSVRMQSTPEKSRNEGTYYSLTDIYKMADITYDPNVWYPQVLKDSMYKGALTSVPMFASVPYVVYNKELMNKYMGEGKLPKNYTELSKALKAAYAEESKTNSSFKSILTLTDWTYKEATSSVAFLQNGAVYYDYDESTALYGNDWNGDDPEGAITALTNTYDLFAANGDCHGGVGKSGWWDAGVINDVNDGKALMGIVNFANSNQATVAANNIGVMPLSGLFTDNTDAASKRIPVHTVGLAFYKASKVSELELAAGAVFADYCSKHSYAFTEKGWYPIRKDCADPEKFDAVYKDLLKNIGDPDDFYTFAGYNNGKNIINTICAEKYVVPTIEATTQPDFIELAKAMHTAIGFEINN